MKISLEKQKKLAYVARRYYLEDQRQSDIARELGVSRPMVSRMLSEARELGVVEIVIHEPGTQAARLLEQLERSHAIRGGILVEEGADDDATNQLLSQGAVDLLRQIGTRRLGVGRKAPSPTSARWWETPASPPAITSPTKMSG